MLERHGLPRPTVNHMVQLPDGGVVFMDIAFVGARVDVEYDGKHHEQQWEADAQRRLRIESAGWDYVQVVNCSMLEYDLCEMPSFHQFCGPILGGGQIKALS